MANIDFQPLDFQADTPSGPSANPIAKIDFQPVDFQPASEPTQNPTKRDLTDQDFQKMGDKYGVNPADLKSVAPYYGVYTQPQDIGEALGTGAKAAAGYLGQTVGLGIPQFAYKKLQDENTRKALDELNQIGNSQSSAIEEATKFVAPIPMAGRVASSLGRIGEAAAIGGTYGLTGSKEDQEARGAATGAVLGAGVGTAAEALGKLVNKFTSPEESKIIDNYAKNNQARIDSGADEILAKKSQSEDMLRDLVVDKKATELNPEQQKLVLDEQFTPEQREDFLNPETDQGAVLAQQAKSEGTTPESYLADQVLENRTKQLAEDLSGKTPKTIEDAHTLIDDFRAREDGDQLVSAKWDELSKYQAGLQYIDEAGIRTKQPAMRVGKTLANSMLDKQYVVDMADDKFGTSGRLADNQLNSNYNKMSFLREEWNKQISDIFKQNRGLDSELLGADPENSIVAKFRNGEKLNPQEQEAIDRVQGFFSNWLDTANNIGRGKTGQGITPLNIEKVENYLPRTSMTGVDRIRAYEKQANLVEQQASELLGRNITDFSELSSRDLSTLRSKSEEFQELERGLLLGTNQESIKNPQEFSQKLKQAVDPGSYFSGKMETEATSAFERQDAIPDFLLENNVYKLMDKWANNTFRHIYLREPMAKLSKTADLWERAGGKLEADYLRRNLQDLSGVRPFSGGRLMTEASLAYDRLMDNIIGKAGGKDTALGSMAASLKAVPRVMEAIARNIYPNMIGWKPDQVLLHILHTYSKTAPELGGPYGYYLTSRSVVDVAKNWSQLAARAEELGLHPAQFVESYKGAMAQGIERTVPYRTAAKVISGMNEAGMYLFRKSDEMNRMIMLSTTDKWVADLMQGSKSAQAALDRMPSSIRRAAAPLVQAQDTEGLTKLLAQHLNATTQYNYNRASMSEFGRVMGPLFSTFTKWPTATAGDMLRTISAEGKFRGSLRIAEKYLIPLFLFHLGDTLLTDQGKSGFGGDYENVSDRQRALLGSHGLSKGAAAGTIMPLIQGKFFAPPVIDTLYSGAILPILKGDQKSDAMTMFSRAFENFAPQAGFVRFMTQDIPTVITNKKPTGNFFQKSAEGLQQITK